MLVDNVSDYQTQFSKWWTQEWKAVTFPEKVGGATPCITPDSAAVNAMDLAV